MSLKQGKSEKLAQPKRLRRRELEVMKYPRWNQGTDKRH